jgi:hypothetical protein
MTSISAENAWTDGGQALGNKIAIVAAASLNEVGYPIHAEIVLVTGFCSEAIADWSMKKLTPGSYVLSNSLACFHAAITANCHHKAIITGCQHPSDLPQFRWINTLLGNLKTRFSGTFHAFNFEAYARRFLGCCWFHFNRHFGITERRSASPMRSAAACPARSGTSGSRWIMRDQVNRCRTSEAHQALKQHR